MKAFSHFTRSMMATLLLAFAVLPLVLATQAVTASTAHAAVVSAVEVRGNQRVDDETIVNYVGIKPNVPFNDGDIDEGVKRLFSTGLFSDVRANVVSRTLVISVEEYAVINQVLFQGNKKLKDDALLRVVQLKPGGTFSQSILELDEQAIIDAYSRIGRSDAIVTSQVIELGENRVNVAFNVNEGGRTKISQINFVGNEAFSDRRLAGVISTKKSNLLSFLARDDLYDEERLRADEEALRRFYYNRGYADFRIISSTATLDDATNEYSVTITVEEGERYRFGSIDVDSTVEGVDRDSLRGLIETKEGAVYSAEDVENTLIAVTEHLAGIGYVFAEVTPRGDRDFQNRTISVVYSIDQGARTYIQRIEIRGNTRTRDYVIRREFDIAEGDAFNQVLIQKAKRRLEDLDFFNSVNISTVPGDQPDQVVLVVDVSEKSTGEFSIGAGYSTGGEDPGPSVEVGVTERNFLGRGQYIKVAVGGGENSRSYLLSFTEPYFLGRRISAGFDIFKQTRDDLDYETDMIGGTIRFGLPITDALSASVAYSYTEQEYAYRGNNAINNCPPAAGVCPLPLPIQVAVATSPWKKSSISGGLVYNTIDDMKDPREGIYATLATEFAGLGGDANYVKVTARANYYRMLVDSLDVVGLVTAGAGHIEPLSGGGISVFDLFQANSRIVRGFENGGFGPASAATGYHLGGTTYFHGSVEAQFPMPLLPESFGVRGAVFADAGTLFGNPLTLGVGDTLVSGGSDIRASVGAGIIWNSPFGPLRVDYAVPVRSLPSDKIQEFNFGISGRF